MSSADRRGSRCCGCRQIIAATAWCCEPCRNRLPEATRLALTHAVAELRRLHAEAEVWLRSHPHATARELEMIALAARGLRNADIGAKLGVTENTVRTYFRVLADRWECRGGRITVVAKAFELGYLTVGVSS